MVVSALFTGLIFGAFGMGYIVYGRKQEKGIALCSGIALCVAPYFGLNIVVLILIGLALIVLPFIFRY